MNHKLVFIKTAYEKIISANQEAKNVWKEKGFSTPLELFHSFPDQINSYNSKFNVVEIEVVDDLEIYGSTCNYFGVIESIEPNPVIKAYVFITEPRLGSRSAFLEQQCFPVLSSVINEGINSKNNNISNRPVYILNINTDNMTQSMALSIISAKIVGFNVIDIMNNDVESIFALTSFNPKKSTIESFERILSDISKKPSHGLYSGNSFFELDSTNKTIIFLDRKFRDNKSGNLQSSLTNQPYWFILKSLAAIYLVDGQNYSFDVSQLKPFETNKTLGSFIKYVKKVGG